jgi:hypothetical protein
MLKSLSEDSTTLRLRSYIYCSGIFVFEFIIIYDLNLNVVESSDKLFSIQNIDDQFVPTNDTNSSLTKINNVAD